LKSRIHKQIQQHHLSASSRREISAFDPHQTVVITRSAVYRRRWHFKRLSSSFSAQFGISKEVAAMKRFVLFAIAPLAIAAIAFISSAQAQGPYCGGGWGGWGANFPYGLYGSRVNDVPYFSMFPPVYYSLPVPRSYGWSPFAYPPGTMTPEVVAEQSQDITNPYVPQNSESKPAKPSSVRTAAYRAPVPQVLINPFVKLDGLAANASTKLSSK
jgi:hypothetical protein